MEPFKLLVEALQLSLLAAFEQLSYQSRCSEEAHSITLLAGGKAKGCGEVGFTSAALGHEMVVKALYRAIFRHRPSAGLIIHSDRGVQYACHGFRNVVQQHGFVQSMSRKGDCWDNAVAESFFGSFKKELVYQANYLTRDQAERDIFEYVESYYNSLRRHSTLGYKTPAEYERLTNAA
jgi:transposase InsO family protein